MGNLEDFFQPVGNVDYGFLLPLQIVDHLEEELDFLVREHCGRFIQNDDLGIPIEDLHNGDQLAHGAAEFADLLVCAHGQRIALEYGRDLFIHGLFADYAAAGKIVFSQKYILRHAELRHQLRALVNLTDAELLGAYRIGQVRFFSVHINLSGVLLVSAGQDLHQRTLARSVLSHQRKRFALIHIQGYVFQGMDDTDRLVQVLNFNR